MWAKAVLVLLVLCLAVGCTSAPQRYLSQEEDANMRAFCEPRGGCVLVPTSLWENVEKFLRALAGKGQDV